MVSVSFNLNTPPQSAEGHAEFRPLSESLNPSDQEILRKKIGEQHFAELKTLSKETDPELYWEALLHFGQRLQRSGHLEGAIWIYGAIAAPPHPLPLSPRGEGKSLTEEFGDTLPSPLGERGRGEGATAGQVAPSHLQHQAQLELEAIQGQGDVGRRLEFLGGQVIKDSLSYKMVIPFSLGAGAYQLGRTAALSRYAASAGRAWYERGLGARFAASFHGIKWEAPMFAISSRGLRDFGGEDISWNPLSIGKDVFGAWIMLSTVKGAGFGGEQAFLKIHRLNEITVGAWRAMPLQGIQRFNQIMIPQASMFGGMLLSHGIETELKLRDPAMDGATFFTDALVSQLSMVIGGNVANRIPGESWQRLQVGLGIQANIFTKVTERRSRPTIHPNSGLIPVGAWRAMPLQDAERPNLQNILMATSNDGRDPTPSQVKIDKSGPFKTDSGEPRVVMLDDLPGIKKALLPQSLPRIQSSPKLPRLLKQYGANLKKLERVMGNLQERGAAPFVGRYLAEALLEGRAPDLSLVENPLVSMIAAALAKHYEVLEDLVGRRIYQDLCDVLEILQNGRPKKYQEAERIILKNLELDPFNPWFIHLGHGVSLKLGEGAQQRPEYFEELQGFMEKLPKKWRRSVAARLLQEDIIGKYRKRYLKAADAVTYTVNLVSGLVEPIILYGFLGFVHYPFMGLRYLFRTRRAGQMAIETSNKFERRKKKTNFEIHFYYGNYAEGLKYAEKGSKPLLVFEILNHLKLGERYEQRIELEEVPPLNPYTVIQANALRELQQRLEYSPVLHLMGIPGSSKTTLAVQLAHEYLKEPDNWLVFWYTLREGKKPDVKRFLDHLAYFLETKSPELEQGLLRRLQDEQAIEAKIEILKGALRRNPSRIFLDNFHLVLEDKEVSELIRWFIPLQLMDTKVITISRRGQDWLRKIGTPILEKGGMSEADAGTLFWNLGVIEKLGREQFAEVFERTGGLPQSLVLFANLIQDASPARVHELVEGMMQRSTPEDVLKFLFYELYNSLGEEQQQTLQYLAIFREPITKEAMVYLGHQGDVILEQTLVPMRDRLLLQEHQPGYFGLHEPLKNLTFAHLGDASELHRRAAEYYRAHAKFPSDYLEGAHHFFHAKEYDQAVKMLAEQVPELLQRGYLSRLEELLSSMKETLPLKPELRATVFEQKARVAEYKGEWDLAITYLKKAMAIKKRQAEEWTVANLYEWIGKIHDQAGETKKAVRSYEKSVELLRKIRNLHGVARVFYQLGVLEQKLGEGESAKMFFKESLRISKMLGDTAGQADAEKALVDLETGA